MDILSTWAVPEDAEPFQIQDIGLLVTFSPDSQTICKASPSSVDFISKDSCKSLGLDVGSKEKITCIETVLFEPWTIAAGTSTGNVIFFTKDKELTKISPLNLPISKLKLCNYRSSQFTLSCPSLIVEYPPEMVIIPIDSLKQKLKNAGAELQVNKWHINHQYQDAVLINSSISSPIISGIHEFPAVYTIGDSPFFAVSSVAKPATPKATEYVKKAVTGFFRWVAGADPPKEEEQLPKSPYQWDIKDEGRVTRTIDADPTGRWIAICDTQGRVTIIDSVFGHIVKVLKGLRDSQVAWAEGTFGESILIIYAPSRRMIIACSAPSGDLIDAVKCESGGKLVQFQSPKYGFGFVDAKRRITIFTIKTEKKEVCEQTEYSYLEFPSFLLAEESEAVQQSRNAKSDDERIKAASLCKNVAEADACIRSALAIDASDEVVLGIIDQLKDKFMKPFDDSSAALDEFWKTNSTSLNQMNPELLFTAECKLAEYWRENQKRATRKVDVASLPKSRITQYITEKVASFSDVRPINPPPFTAFLRSPTQFTAFFFDFASAAKSVDDYYAAFRISRTDKDVFVDSLLEWCLNATPSELALAQGPLTQFLLLPGVKDELYKTDESLRADKINEAVIGLIASSE